ncbi:Manganese/iron superoxide dismutase [Xylogone sp. PMI_703]|nr:Manganese/iron superoxide dismutase [Xylogone sp. PMI_703]
MLRPRLPRIGFSLRRALHQVPPLTHDFRNGVPGLLSPAGFNMAWTQYQSLMVEKLNNLIVGGTDEFKTPKELLIKYARDPNAAPIFNYASMAHNNAFFFSCLSPGPTTIPEILKKELEASFSSMETLQREFILTASSMFGPGFVWLVRTRDRKYSLLATYLAGSPYPGAHYRRQDIDMNTQDDKSLADYHRRVLAERGAPVNTVGAHGQFSKKDKLAPGGIDLTPVLCVNTWEHVYLPDYGIGANGVGGKRAFVEAWWNTIDWNVVANYADVNGSKFQT